MTVKKNIVEGQAGRSQLLEQLVEDTLPDLIEFCRRAEQETELHRSETGPIGTTPVHTSLVHPTSASHETLRTALGSNLAIEEFGSGLEGLQRTVKDILKYSVNPSAPGFLDKLYSAPLPPGVLAELVLGVLNTNLHVYDVSPVLSIIEKDVGKRLANMFGLNGPRSGGISVQGGSASNMTSIVIARNTLFPETKKGGNSAVSGRLTLFTSAHGHYSIEKAAQALGLGSENVVSVPVDESGKMLATELRRLIENTRNSGNIPFYVNATAGSTVLGSFDPFEDIAQVTKEHGIWLHIDAAWGGGFIFSRKAENKRKLLGSGLADSIATNPHKMLGVPVTCSFLLGKDLKQFQDANTLKAEYLFHDKADDLPHVDDSAADTFEGWEDPYDLADLTLQCGRRGDSLKLFFSWKFYGTEGYSDMVDKAYDLAYHMSRLVQRQSNLRLVLPLSQGPSCLQICFYYTFEGRFTYGLLDEPGHLSPDVATETLENANGFGSRPSQQTKLGKFNSRVTANIAKALIPRGFMVDYAPALEGQEDRGSFFRVVLNISTIKETVERLVEEVVTVGNVILTDMKTKAALTSFEPRDKNCSPVELK